MSRQPGWMLVKYDDPHPITGGSWTVFEHPDNTALIIDEPPLIEEDPI